MIIMEKTGFIEYIGVFIWLVLLPVFGIVGYIYDISWLFYVCGGIMLLSNAAFLFFGALRCLGAVLLILACIIGYYLTHSLWMGMLLGSCITSAILSVGMIVLMCFSGFSAVTGLFKKDSE
jgi:hypothetical protein